MITLTCPYIPLHTITLHYITLHDITYMTLYTLHYTTIAFLCIMKVQVLLGRKVVRNALKKKQIQPPLPDRRHPCLARRINSAFPAEPKAAGLPSIRAPESQKTLPRHAQHSSPSWTSCPLFHLPQSFRQRLEAQVWRFVGSHKFW